MPVSPAASVTLAVTTSAPAASIAGNVIVLPTTTVSNGIGDQLTVPDTDEPGSDTTAVSSTVAAEEPLRTLSICTEGGAFWTETDVPAVVVLVPSDTATESRVDDRLRDPGAIVEVLVSRRVDELAIVREDLPGAAQRGARAVAPFESSRCRTRGWRGR